MLNPHQHNLKLISYFFRAMMHGNETDIVFWTNDQFSYCGALECGDL